MLSISVVRQAHHKVSTVRRGLDKLDPRLTASKLDPRLGNLAVEIASIHLQFLCGLDMAVEMAL